MVKDFILHNYFILLLIKLLSTVLGLLHSFSRVTGKVLWIVAHFKLSHQLQITALKVHSMYTSNTGLSLKKRDVVGSEGGGGGLVTKKVKFSHKKVLVFFFG